MSAKTKKPILFQDAAKLFALLAASLFLAVPGAAQSMFPARLNVEQAVDKTLENNPQTKIADAGIKLATAAVDEAKTGKKPFVQFSQNVIRSNNPVFVFGSLLEQGRFTAANFSLGALNKPDGLFNFRTLVSAQKPIFDQRQTRSRVSIADKARQQSEFRAEIVRQQLRFNVVQNFFGAILAKEMVTVSGEAVKSAEANLKKTKDMVDVGMTTDADYLAADVELANQNQQKLEAESNLATTFAALNITMGNKPDLELELNGDLTERFFPAEEQDVLMALALENRLEMKSADLAIESTDEQKRAIENQKLPQVSAFGNVGYSSPYIANGSTDYTIGVSLNYTIFDAGRKARIEQAASRGAIAGFEKEDLANRVRLEVIRAAQNFKTSKAKIQVSVKSIAQAQEALRIVQDRYKFGLTTFNEVIRAETAFVSAKHFLAAARYQYYVSFASVLLATGRLTDVRAFQ